LSAGELAFYRVLRRAVGKYAAISLKTRLADVVRCPPELWETAHGRRLSQKHLDFVLYDRFTTVVLAAVELDDRSHDRPERRQRDQFLDETLARVGIVLIRFRAAQRYDLAGLEERLRDAGAIPARRTDEPAADAKPRHV
jgi:hypothetical protein